jgi:hypothetical protein
MPPAVTRELSIAYGSLTVGGTSATHLLDGTSRITLQEDYEKASASFTVLVVGDTEANFATNCLALENAYRIPRQTFTITQGSATLKSWSHSGNTGYNTNPSCSKINDKASTGRSRRYTCTVEVERPADLSGQGGRRSSSVSLIKDSDGKATVSIAGKYTATPGATARANYNANIVAYATAVKTALVPNAFWNKLHEESTHDDDNKNLDFTRVYEQVPNDVSQAIGNTDSTGDAGTNPFSQWKFSVSKSQQSVQAALGKNARRLVTFTSHFEGLSNAGQSGLSRYIDTVITVLMMNALRRQFNIGAAVLTSRVVNIPSELTSTHTDSPVTVDMTFVASDGSNVLEYEYNISQNDSPGIVIQPVWDSSPYAAYLFPGQATSERTVTERILTFDDGITFQRASGPTVPPASGVSDGGEWITIRRDVSEKKTEEGLEGAKITLVDRTFTTVQKFVRTVSGGASGGGFIETQQGGNSSGGGGLPGADGKGSRGGA